MTQKEFNKKILAHESWLKHTDGAGFMIIRHNTLNKIEVYEADLENAIFQGVCFANCTFININFANALFRDCSFHNVIFDNCCFDEALFGWSNMVDSDFLSSHFDDAKFVKVRAIGCKFNLEEIKNITFFDFISSDCEIVGHSEI